VIDSQCVAQALELAVSRVVYPAFLRQRRSLEVAAFLYGASFFSFFELLLRVRLVGLAGFGCSLRGGLSLSLGLARPPQRARARYCCGSSSSHHAQPSPQARCLIQRGSYFCAASTKARI
jgi:hypothetical protein